MRKKPWRSMKPPIDKKTFRGITKINKIHSMINTMASTSTHSMLLSNLAQISLKQHFKKAHMNPPKNNTYHFQKKLPKKLKSRKLKGNNSCLRR